MKVLDFGLAKALRARKPPTANLSNSPTLEHGGDDMPG